jgi:hypothetical protein
MKDVAIDKEAFLALWKLDELPACDEGMELARHFLIRDAICKAKVVLDLRTCSGLSAGRVAIEDECSKPPQTPRRQRSPDLMGRRRRLPRPK